MKYAYTMLTDGNCGDWGQCMLIEQTLGELIQGKRQAKDLPKDLLCFLARGYSPITDEDLEDFTDEDFEKIEEELGNKNSYDCYTYNFLANAIYDSKTPYIIEFKDIAHMANYVRLNNIQIIENLLT